MPAEESTVDTAEEQDTAEAPEQDLKLGELGPFDYSTEPFLDLSDEEKKEIRTLVTNCSKRDTAARRMEVEQAWEARLFKRGYQYLLPRKGGGWYLPSPTTGFGPGKQIQQAALYETNIYGAHCDILTSALVRDIPQCRFEPFNPSYDPDITAADAAEDFKEIFARNNDLRAVHTQAADYMCTDGRVLFYTGMVLDGQRFGYEDPADDNPVAPEDETSGPSESPNVEEGQQQAQEANDSPLGPGPRKPRGREITRVYGKLEHKVPIQTQDISEMGFVQVFEDVFVARAKGMFPWVAEKIKPGGQGVSETELDRIARINVNLSLPGTYVTGDSFNKDCTIQRNWIRPCEFLEISDEKGLRTSIMEKAPDGMLVIYAGDTFCYARNESMDDHLHVLHCFPGSGQNRIALMSKVLSLQKRLNNWIDLLNDYFIKFVPRRWYPSQLVDIEAMQLQVNAPGESSPYQWQPGVNFKEALVIEDSPSPNPMMWEVIQAFFNEFPEMLSGALPSLFGAESNTDTVGGISIQRDQALGRLSSPWGALQAAVAVYYRQAVQCAAKCREKLGQTKLSEAVGGKTVTVEISDLKGNVLCFPEVDSNFPETWIQRSSRFQQLITESAGNPWIQKLLSLPKNMKIAKDATGFTDLDVPEAASVDKQLGEFEILLKSGPVPNPMIEQAKEQLTQHAQEADQQGQQQQFEQMLQQAQQAITELPPMVSTVPVMQDASEDHATEAQTCLEKMNSPEGRRMKRGTAEERQAWANLHLHWQEHDAMAKKLAPPSPTKPPSESMSAAIDKMPPGIATQLLNQYYGINASPEEFQEQDATETEQKITEKAADFGHGVIPPANGSEAATHSGAK